LRAASISQTVSRRAGHFIVNVPAWLSRSSLSRPSRKTLKLAMAALYVASLVMLVVFSAYERGAPDCQKIAHSVDLKLPRIRI
jgi:hypothetical protein